MMKTASNEPTEYAGFTADEEIFPPDYSYEEEKFRGEIIRQLNNAYNQRQQEFVELDGMTYDDYYVTNKKAGNAYIPPKLNKEDTRVVTGTTREKVNTLVSNLMNYEMQPSITPYDELSLPNRALGMAMEDLVKKSRKLEIPDYDVKKPLIYKELVEQGTVFVLERYSSYSSPKKIFANDEGEMEELTWRTVGRTGEKFCNVELLNGLNVYLGNIREFYMELQPYVGLRFERTRQEAESMYGEFKRWGNVPKKINHTAANSVNGTMRPYDNWSMVEIDQDMVEEMWYMNKWTNTLQIMLNGVMMLPCGFPLSYLSGMEEYPVIKGDVEPIGRYFAYSRSIPAKNKFSQAVMDEMFKGIILKTRKSYQPPMANFTGQSLTKKIFYPGTITDNIDPAKLQEIGQNNGPSLAEFNALQLVKQVIDESSVSAVFEGNSTRKRQTAKEILELKNQSMQKLGLTIAGVINLEKKMAWFRLNNILMNWTSPLDETLDDTKKKIKQYRTENIETEFEDGIKGEHVIEFNENIPHSEQVKAQENILSHRRGKVVRKTIINPEELKGLKYRWFIEVSPGQKETSELRGALFEESVTKAKSLFPNQTNDEYLKTVWANYQKLDPKKFWLQTPAQPGMPGQAGLSGVGANLQPNPPQTPSLQNMVA